jgi:hypothetical protein
MLSFAPKAAAAAALVLLAASSASASTPSRGVGWPWFETTAVNALYSKGKTVWTYNWETYLPTGGSYSPMEYVPMQRTADNIASLASASSVKTASWLLGFNEPDMSTSVGGSNISPTDAAKLWKQYIAPLRTSSRKLVAPAVSVSTAANQGYDWLKQFKAACTGCVFDAYAIHPYASSADQVQDIIETWINDYKVTPLWITEFGVESSVAKTQGGKKFVEAMIEYFNSKSSSVIARYAYIARQAQSKSVTGQDLQFTNGSLRVMGKAYRDASASATC